MRTMILLSLSVFTVIVFGSYSVAWYMQSRALESSVTDGIASLNAKHPYITYDSIKTSGYPSDITVTIINPRFSGRVDDFLKQLDASAGMQKIPAWEEDITLNGKMEFSVNVFANKFNLYISGNPYNTSKIGGKTHSVATKTESATQCTLQFDNRFGIFGTLWDFQSLVLREPKDFVQDLALFDCTTPAYSVTDRNTNDVLMTGGVSRIFITNTEGEGNDRSIRTFLQSKDQEVTEKGDVLMKSYMLAFSADYPFPPSSSLYGKRNIELDFSYSGPIPYPQALNATPLDIKLSKLNLSNRVYNTDASFHFSNGKAGNDRVTRLIFNAKSTFSEQYNQLLEGMVRGFVLQLYSPFVPQPADIQPLIRKYSADDLYRIIYPAIPHMHSLGNLSQSLDFSYQGNDDLSVGKVTFSNLDLSSAPYGITGKGDIQFAQNQPFPVANVGLSCSNCLRLVDDVADYSQRLQRVVATLSDNNARFTAIEEPLAEGLKAFLSGLAEPSQQPNVFNYNIVSDGTSNLSISGKSLAEVMALYGQTLSTVPAQPVTLIH
jgi:hypothetical protein